MFSCSQENVKDKAPGFGTARMMGGLLPGACLEAMIHCHSMIGPFECFVNFSAVVGHCAEIRLPLFDNFGASGLDDLHDIAEDALRMISS